MDKENRLDISSRFISSLDAEVLNLFAHGERVLGEALGVFVSGDQKYDEKVTAFLDAMVRCYLEMLEDPRRIKEKEKEILKYSKQFLDFLSRVGVVEVPEPQTYSTAEPGKEPERAVLDDGESPFGRSNKVYYLKPAGDKDGDLFFYYYDDDLKDMLYDLYEKYEGGEIDRAEYLRRIGGLKRVVLRSIIEDFLASVKDMDEEVREFFEEVLKLFKYATKGTNPDGSKRRRRGESAAIPLIERLVKIEVDVFVGYTEEGEEGEEMWTHKPVFTRLGYGDPKLSYEEVLERLSRDGRLKNTLAGEEGRDGVEKLRRYFERLKKPEEERGIGVDVEKLLKKVYGEESKRFLPKVRKELSKLLSGKVKGVKRISFRKGEKPAFTIKRKRVEGYRHTIVFLVEPEVRELAKLLAESIRETGESFLNTKGMLAWEVLSRTSGTFRGLTLQSVFPFWEELKKCNFNAYEDDLGRKLLVTLLQFAAFMEALRIKGEQDGVRYALLVALNTNVDKENGRGESGYPFWDAVRALGDLISVPFQTLTRRTLETIASEWKRAKEGKKSGKYHSFLKNAYLSFLRGDKKLVLELSEESLGGIKTALPWNAYLLIENPSKAVEYGGRNYRHAFYRRLKVTLTKRGTIEIEEEEPFVILADGLTGDWKGLDDFLKKEKDKAVFVISQSTQSPVAEFLSKEKLSGKYFVLYRVQPTPLSLEYLKQKRGKVSTNPFRDTQNAYVIVEEKYKEGFDSGIGIFTDELEDYTLYAIRAPLAIPPHLTNHPYVSTSTSLFFIKDFKAQPDEAKCTILTLLSWLIYENESFSFFYSKPKFTSVKLPKVVISREVDRKRGRKFSYTIPLSTSVVELAYLYHRWRKSRIVPKSGS